MTLTPHRISAILLCLSLGPGVASAAPGQDAPKGIVRLVTEDGRVLECEKAREADDVYELTFPSGKIQVPKRQIAEVAIEGDMSDYVPQNEDEEKKLEQGFVRYNGRWLSKAAYQSELNKRNEQRRKRMQERELHTDFSNAWEKETKHFVVKTNTSPELLEHYAELLETYYDLMDKRVGIKPSPTLRRTKMTVNIYKSAREFQELSAAGVGPSVLGYFWAYDQTLNFFHDYQEPSRSEWVGLHECTHLLTYLIDPQFNPSAKSIWVNEGVADLFGSSEIRRDKKGRLEIIPGKLQTDRILTVQQAIKEGNDTKIEDLLTLKREDFDGFQYAHAWSFVYFLMEANPKYEKGFKSFFKDLYALNVEKKDNDYGPDKSGVQYTVPPDEVRRLLLKKLGLKNTEALEKEWKAFIAETPIEAPEARFKRGYRLVRGFVPIGETEEERAKSRAEALEDINFAIDSGLEDARAFWARGLLLASTGNLASGLPDYRKAIDLDPLNPAYRFDAAQLLCGRLFSFSIGYARLTIEYADGSDRLRGTEEELREAKMQFGLAMDLDPENDLYAETYDEFMALYESQRDE